LCCFDLSFWKWPWFVSFCCHVLCSLGRRFVSCDIVDVYSILLWCVSVILSGLLLLSPILSLVLFGGGRQMARVPDVPPIFLVPAGRLHPNRSIQRDFELFDEFALFAIDKWYQLPANSSVRKIQSVYRRLVSISGVWLHFEWTWKLARDLCWHLRRVALIRARVEFIRLPHVEPEWRLPP